jgi:hypothetical protein
MRLDHPTDRRLHAEIHTGPCGLVLDLLVNDEAEPTVRFGVDEDGWDPGRPIFWQVIDVLCCLGFLSVADVADALDADGQPRDRLSRRLQRVADLVATVRTACE